MHILKYICFLLLIYVTGNKSIAQNLPDTAALLLKITDSRNEPVFGVYVINKNRNLLITSTDIDGECRIHRQLFPDTDSIQFQGMGYKADTYRLRDLYRLRHITLEELNFELNELVVTGIPAGNILEKAALLLQKKYNGRTPVCRKYGKSQYEKITEYKDTAIEYRREYGYYFTSGNTKARNVWDQAYRSYFLPAYTARSFNLTNNSSDTLSPLYMTNEDTRFDAGTRKVFTLVRTVQLYAPLFHSIQHYDIHPVGNDSAGYVFAFQTRPAAYPSDVRISCKGQLYIEYRTYRLRKIDFDYIDYQLFRQVILTNRRKTNSPFSTKATLTFNYTPEGEPYVESCRQETIWKHNLGEDFILIEQPSRMHPAQGKLIEKEAFFCYDYLPVREEYQTPNMLSKIHVAQRNPIGRYDSLLFRQLPSLLDARQATENLNRFCSLEKQFQKNHNKAYYPENFINGFNGFAGRGRADNAYRKNIHAVREQLFEFFQETSPLLSPQ